jgi:hypothetical protein
MFGSEILIQKARNGYTFERCAVIKSYFLRFKLILFELSLFVFPLQSAKAQTPQQ